MTKWKTILGYVWAGLGIPILLAGFMGQDFLVQKLFVESGLKISARWSGGEVVQTIDHETYQTAIHRPVFDGLFGERSKGFVQIDWQSEQRLPDLIEENIDFDRDGQDDFQIILNTKTNEATLTPVDSRIISITEEWGVLVFKNARTVRVALRKNLK
jgi:hypothetical protein